MLNLYYDKLIGKTEEYEGKRYVMINYYELDNALDKIKRMDIKRLRNTRFFY